jgi:hypothetical protein
MNKFKNVIRLSLVATLFLSTSLYAEEYYHDGYNDYHEDDKAPQKESIDISHSIIQNIYATKHQKKKATKSGKGGSGDFKSLIIMDSERSTIEQGSTDATSSAFKLSYDRDFSNNSDIGTFFSYRVTKDDDSSQKSQEISLAPYYKYYKDLAENIDIEVVANLLLETRKFSGTPSYDSYQTYGLGVTAIPGYYIGEKVMLNLPIGLQNIKRGSASGDDDLQTLATYGITGEVKISENWFVNANILQTKDIDSDSNIEANYYVLQTNYYGEYWNFGLGYKTVENVSNYSEDTYMLSVMYNW